MGEPGGPRVRQGVGGGQREVPLIPADRKNTAKGWWLARPELTEDTTEEIMILLKVFCFVRLWQT